MGGEGGIVHYMVWGWEGVGLHGMGHIIKLRYLFLRSIFTSINYVHIPPLSGTLCNSPGSHCTEIPLWRGLTKGVFTWWCGVCIHVVPSLWTRLGSPLHLQMPSLIYSLMENHLRYVHMQIWEDNTPSLYARILNMSRINCHWLQGSFGFKSIIYGSFFKSVICYHLGVILLSH